MKDIGKMTANNICKYLTGKGSKHLLTLIIRTPDGYSFYSPKRNYHDLTLKEAYKKMKEWEKMMR